MKRKSKPLKFVLILVLGLCAFIIYAFFVEPNRLELTYLGNADHPTSYPLESELRIAFFADLHIYKYRGFHDRLLQQIEGYHPDLIMFGGDALAKFTDVKDLELFFQKLKEIAPVYTNFGNWEEYAPVHMRQRFENLDITLIEKETKVLNIKGLEVAITGLESHYFLPQTETVQDKQAHDLSVMLIHSPIGIEDKMQIIENYDLVLAGHFHGGQYYIKYLTKKILELRNGRDISYFAGAYEYKDTMIFVTRGVGQWFPGRFNCLPELVIIDLSLPINSERGF